MKNTYFKSTKSCFVLFTIALVFLVGGRTAVAQPNLEKVIDLDILERLDQGETVDVIVLLKEHENYVGKMRSDEPADMAAIQTEIRSRQEAVLNRLTTPQFELKYQYENILGFSGRVTQNGLIALTAMPEVELIEEDDVREANLGQGIPLMNALTVRSNYNGTGVSVAVSDTGIDYNHAMLGGGGFPNSKVIGGRDFADDDSNPMDCGGHGTSVAGIAAGTIASGPGDYIGGVAYNARLYALKISWNNNCGYSTDSLIAASWDWAVSHKYDDSNNPILIVNTSFGGGGYSNPCDASEPTLAAAANNLVANDITLFASSGNDAFTNRMGAPACVDGAISVGAVYDANLGPRYWSRCTDSTTAPDKVTCYSNSAYFLDLLAPSNDAYTTYPGGGFRPNFGGTSAASPYSAGAGAILQSYAKATTGSYYLPAELKALLVNNGIPITDPKSGITTPRVNVDIIFEPPIADIKANGSDGPITIPTSDTLSITIALDAAGNTNNADWWCLADTPMDWYHYDLSTVWLPGIIVSYQGLLGDMAPYEVLDYVGLPTGSYTFYFGVDMNMNGSIDMGQMYYDSVAVTVTP
jgi:subtilisin family serine protease